MEKTKVAIISVISLALTLFVVFCVGIVFGGESLNTEFIAHRGHGYYDNTAEAFYNSKDYWGIECDVRVTKDGEFVLSHDDDFKDDNNRRISVRNSTLSELQSVSFGGGYKICTFREYLYICKALNKTAIIELKPIFSDNEVSKLIEEIDQNYNRKKCNIISFEKENLLKFKGQNIELQLLFSASVEDNINFCIENKINASMFFAIITEKDVARLHKYNLKVGAWTVNSREVCDTLISYGVDYITSDILYN